MSCGTTSRLSWLSMQLGSTEGMGNNKKFRLRVMKLLCISNGRSFADVPNRRQVGESEMQVTSDSESAMRKNVPSRLQSVSQSIYSFLENLYLGHGGELSGSSLEYQPGMLSKRQVLPASKVVEELRGATLPVENSTIQA